MWCDGRGNRLTGINLGFLSWRARRWTQVFAVRHSTGLLAVVRDNQGIIRSKDMMCSNANISEMQSTDVVTPFVIAALVDRYIIPCLVLLYYPYVALALALTVQCISAVVQQGTPNSVTQS